MILPLVVIYLCSTLMFSAHAYAANTTNADANTTNAVVYSIDSSPFGISYRDWITKWWQWNVGFGAEDHPRDHFSPQTCKLNQNGPVWFLPDLLSGMQDRSCTIPQGKAILVPLLTGSCWNDHLDPELETDSGLRKCAMQGNEYGEITATIDGRNLQNLQDSRIQSPVFNITVPDNSTFRTGNAPSGNFKAISDGYFVFLKPLPAGKHDLILTTNVQNPIAPSYDFSAKSNFHLDVPP